nr:coatomer subunit beta'-2-like [Tanacetum cinerariifolium]
MESVAELKAHTDFVRHITGNKCYLTDYEDYDGGFVSFGDGKCRISGKGKIKTRTLDFNDVYFCKELKYNLFIRAAKFVANKEWIVCGADDGFIRVYNYNTMESVAELKAHTDFVRHITGNKCYLTDYEDYDGGFVSFGDGKCRISGKGKIKTRTLDFNDVYFCKELKYNLFIIQAYDTIPPPQVVIALPAILPQSLVLLLSPMFDSQDLFPSKHISPKDTKTPVESPILVPPSSSEGSSSPVRSTTLDYLFDESIFAKLDNSSFTHVNTKETEDKSKEKRLKDALIVPGAAPVARAPYQLAPFRMKDLSEQLKVLSDKGFIRPSFLTMGSSSPIGQKEGWIVQDVHRLPGIKQSNGKEPLPTAKD